MTMVREPVPAESATEIRYIQTVLIASKLPVREPVKLARNMVTATQPLIIDKTEICTDTILAEFVRYPSIEQMQRETATLTLKKAAYGAFESSLTPIPKYCFTDIASLRTILVHSIHRFTLSDILAHTEKEYSHPYPHKPLLLYRHWLKVLCHRIGYEAKNGKLQFIRKVVTLSAMIFAPPRHISQAERKTFAYRIVATVKQHHDNHIYHDRISERTIFFPTSYQPQFLANYAGVPSSMLYDQMPQELMKDGATAQFGPQCRDVYCIALVCYRILTGIPLDGRRFSLETPRPLGMVFKDIFQRNLLSFSIKNSAGLKRTLDSFFTTITTIFSLLPHIFSGKQFVAWRNLNRATGKIVRSLPVFGEFCDIFLPTRQAWILRLILDKQWFLSCFATTKLSGKKRCPHAPDIALLASVMRVPKRMQFSKFENVFTTLNHESVVKRNAFGSIMESRFSIKRAYRRLITAKQALFLATAALVLIAPLLLLVFNSQRPDTTPSLKEAQDQSTLPVTVAAPATIDTARFVFVPLAPDTEVANAVIRDSALDAAVQSAPQIPPVSPKKPRAATTPSTKRKSSVPAGKKASLPKENTSEVASVNDIVSLPATDPAIVQVMNTDTAPVLPPPPKKGLLLPVNGSKNVFVVTDISDSINPGSLYYSIDGKDASTMISRLPTAFRRLYLAHRSVGGFDSILVIRLCRTDGCDPSMYYEPIGIERVGNPVFVRSGDAISPSRLKLWTYIRDRH